MNIGISLGVSARRDAPAGGGGAADNNPAFDAYTSPAGAIGTGNLSWTHTPVGTPKGVIVFVNQYFEATDYVTAVTYGGVSMTEVTVSPAASTDNAVYAYFLGTGIPTGDQTVAVTSGASAGPKRATCITVTGDADLSVISAKHAATGSSPSASLDIETDSFVAAALTAQVASPTAITEDAAYTSVYEYDFGSSSMAVVRRTANPTSGTIAVPFTLGSSQPFALLAVAIA